MTHVATLSPIPSELPPGVEPDSDYWHCLIAEKPAAAFLNVTPRKMQHWRQQGDGPPYIRLSARSVKYTRGRLKKYADERLRISTADPGPEAAP